MKDGVAPFTMTITCAAVGVADNVANNVVVPLLRNGAATAVDTIAIPLLRTTAEVAINTADGAANKVVVPLLDKISNFLGEIIGGVTVGATKPYLIVKENELALKKNEMMLHEKELMLKGEEIKKRST